jgi:large subunit ribosomal protein L17
MRHQKKTVKLGRTASHRDALLANQVVSLIEHSRIQTTLAKAKAVRPLAEKLLTLGKKNTLHARRTALSYLHHNEDAVRKLFSEVAPRSANRNGGYTRIIKLGYRKSDAAPIAYLEWVDQIVTEAPLAVSSASSTTVVEAPAATEEVAAEGAEKPKKPRAKKAKAASEEAAPAAE